MAKPGFSKAVVLKAAPGEKPVTSVVKNVPLNFSTEWIPKNDWVLELFLDWRGSHVSYQLGFPVKIARRPDPTPNPPFNNRVQPLFVNIDTNDPEFGATKADMSLLRGNSMVMRCDEEDLEEGQLSMLIGFINNNFQVAGGYEFPTMAKEKQDSIKAEISKNLNPNAFAAYFEDRRQQLISTGSEMALHLECPVKPDTIGGCAACGSLAKDDQELQPCSRCKRGKARYCSEDCQKVDRKNHVRSCKKALAAQRRAAARTSSEES